MTRKEIEKAAREYALRKGASTSEHERLIGFVIEQINAALDEAARVCNKPTHNPKTGGVCHDCHLVDRDAVLALKIT